ncbi:MAG: DUF262 domain-containing protein [Pseudomonadota bacterium]|nr:DUF262 domain-containing protein [Pseudomonadota bacterium]
MARQPVRIAPEQKAAAEAAIDAQEDTIKYLVTDYTVEFLVGKMRADSYYVPAYQRALVWNEDKQSKFIESVLIGLPIPPLFLWQDDQGRFEIVDGSQRLRTLRRFMDNELRLKRLQLLPQINKFSFQDFSARRRARFENHVIRGFILDHGVGQEKRTEMFSRINTGGLIANEAEVRRGALQGPMSDLILRSSESPLFVALTPISERQVDAREREELAARFYAFADLAEVHGSDVTLPGWRDRPRQYIYDFVEQANADGAENPEYIDRLGEHFDQVLRFVDRNFPFGFRKTATSTQVPRVRFEAIAVGCALAISAKPELANSAIDVSGWIDGKEFADITTSDAANVRAKVQGRIGFVVEKLLAA